MSIVSHTTEIERGNGIPNPQGEEEFSYYCVNPGHSPAMARLVSVSHLSANQSSLIQEPLWPIAGVHQYLLLFWII